MDAEQTTAEQSSTVATGNSTMRLLRNCERARNHHTSEREEAREQQLVMDRVFRRACLASESAKERETRLSRCRAQDRARRTARTSRTYELLSIREEQWKCQRRVRVVYINLLLVSTSDLQLRFLRRERLVSIKLELVTASFITQIKTSHYYLD